MTANQENTIERFSSITRRLDECGIEESERESILILSHIMQKSPGEAQAAILRENLQESTLSIMERIVDARCRTKKPLAYLLGEWHFYGLQLYVNDAVMVPRRETEILVETVLTAIPDERILGIDVGTGCGAISTALLLNRRDWRISGSDISKPALKTASANAQKYGVSERFMPVLCDTVSAITSADFIVSNPPYIPSKQIENLESEVRCEPKIALDGGEDGLDFIRKLVGDAMSLNPRIVAFEFGWGQIDEIQKIMFRYGCRYEIINDLAEIPRIALIYS